MFWVISMAALGVATAVFRLGALTVWVAVLSLALRLLAVAAIVALLFSVARHLWFRSSC